MTSAVPLLQGKSNVAAGRQMVKNLRRVPTSFCKVSAPFLTCDLSVERGADKRRISPQGLIECQLFMDIQISLTETSTEECFHAGCCSRKSVPPIICEAPLCPNEILPSSMYTSPQEVTDQNEIQTCLSNVMRISERSLQGNTRLASSSLLSRRSHPFAARHRAKHHAVCSLT